MEVVCDYPEVGLVEIEEVVEVGGLVFVRITASSSFVMFS